MPGDVRTVPTPRAWLWAEGADPERALLTRHFAYREAVNAATENSDDLADELNAISIRAAMLAAAVLEPWREVLGCGLGVNSWARSRTKNGSLPGAAENSDHLYGGGADVEPVSLDGRPAPTLPKAFALLYELAKPRGRGGLPVDQAILYAGHIHVSHEPLQAPARKFYVAEKLRGKVSYRVYVPTSFYDAQDAADSCAGCKP
jgi:hypothetical protein